MSYFWLYLGSRSISYSKGETIIDIGENPNELRELINQLLLECAEEGEEDRNKSAEWKESVERVNQFLLEYTEEGEGFRVGYVTLKHHYFSWCKLMGFSRTNQYSVLLHVLAERSLFRVSSTPSTTVIGIKMKHPVGLPRYYNKGDRKSISNKVKKAVHAKLHSNDDICALCGRPISVDEKVHIDHILPVRQGCINNPSNLQVVHRSCNLAKG